MKTLVQIVAAKRLAVLDGTLPEMTDISRERGQILVDTSVWVNHFKERNEDLVRLLFSDSELIHPVIIVELACGLIDLMLFASVLIELGAKLFKPMAKQAECFGVSYPVSSPTAN